MSNETIQISMTSQTKAADPRTLTWIYPDPDAITTMHVIDDLCHTLKWKPSNNPIPSFPHPVLQYIGLLTLVQEFIHDSDNLEIITNRVVADSSKYPPPYDPLAPILNTGNFSWFPPKALQPGRYFFRMKLEFDSSIDNELVQYPGYEEDIDAATYSKSPSFIVQNNFWGEFLNSEANATGTDLPMSIQFDVSGRPSGGVIAGSAIGCLVFLLLVVMGAYKWGRHRGYFKNLIDQIERGDAEKEMRQSSETVGTPAAIMSWNRKTIASIPGWRKSELDGNPISELDGKPLAELDAESK